MSGGTRRCGDVCSSCALSLCLCLMAGCKKDQQKCDETRAAAVNAWAGYTEALERAMQTAVATQRAAHTKLSGQVEPRLAPAAQKLADSRYDRSSGAWLRAYQSAYHDACVKDDECKRLAHDNTDATAALEDLQERVVLARAARDISTGDLGAAQQAAKAVIVHPEYPQLKLAQRLTDSAFTLCQRAAAEHKPTP